MSEAFDRRRLLAAAFAALAVGWTSGCGGAPRPGAWIPGAAGEAAARLGARCRRALGDPPVEALWQAVEAAVWPLASAGLADGDLRARVAARVADELGRGESVEVDGMWLAPTEARILALAVTAPAG